MLKGDSKENGKNSIGLIGKNKTTLRGGAHFFVHFFATVLHDYNVTLPVTCFMEEMSYVFLSVFFFFTATYFVTSSSSSSTSFSIVICVERFMFSFIFCE